MAKSQGLRCSVQLDKRRASPQIYALPAHYYRLPGQAVENQSSFSIPNAG